MTTRNKKNSLSKFYLNIDKRLVKIATTSSIGMPESGYNMGAHPGFLLKFVK